MHESVTTKPQDVLLEQQTSFDYLSRRLSEVSLTVLDMHPKLVRDLEDAALLCEGGNWDILTQTGEGACIPISYALTEFLKLRGRPARVAETALTARDPRNVQWMEIQPSPAGFLGHAVVIMPTVNLLLDGSLWTQPSKVLANFTIPHLVVLSWKRGRTSYGKIDRLTLKYEPDLKANVWRQRSWPWGEIRKAVTQFNHDILKGG